MNNAQTRLNKSWPPKWLPPTAIVLVALLWPVVFTGAMRAWQSSQNRVEDWLPESLPETRQLVDFFDRFGSDEFLMISWPGCQLGTQSPDALAQRLLEVDAAGKRYFDSAQSGNQVLQSLMAGDNLTRQQAVNRLTGLFIGPDQQQTCVIALVSRAGLDDRRSAVNFAWQQAEQISALPREEIHLAGTTADSTAVDAASNAYLFELNMASWLVCLVILLVALRNIWLVGTLFIVAVFNQQLAMAFIYVTGGHVDSVQLLVSNLSYVLTISAGLHFLGYFREAFQQDRLAPSKLALKNALIPSSLAAVSTSLGFVSLCTSVLVPIQSFGLYSAILVPINTLIVVGLLAIHARWASTHSWRWQKIEPAPILHNEGSQHQGVWARFVVPLLSRAPLVIVGTWLIIIVTVGSGVARLSTSVGTHKLLSPDDKLVRDYAWLEEHVGALVPLELVVRFPVSKESNAQETFGRIALLEQVRRKFTELPEVHSTLSVINFLPPLPEGGGMRNIAKRSVMGKLIDRSRAQFQSMRLYFSNDQEESWRISGRIAGAMEYEALLSKVQAAISQLKSDWQSRESENPLLTQTHIEISGGVPFLYRTQRQMMVDLLSSFSTAFLMIAAAMALLFRSISGGLLTMLPNVTPAAIVFGTMGWCGLEIEIGTVLTASVMMGVCVDDTLHLISHFRSLRAHGWSHKAAVNEALNNCGGAMLQTGLVCGVGMLVFAFSPFVPVARFAWLTFALLSVGVASDILLTPAMLLSPLHHLFYWERNLVAPLAQRETESDDRVAEVST